MKTEIKKIEFETLELKGRAENYPKNGFYISKELGADYSDLTFVDKRKEFVFYVMPFSSFEEIENDFIIKDEIETTEFIPLNNSKEYDSDFILEFARILLNRK